MATTFTTPPVTARQRQIRDFTNLGLWTFQGWIAMFYVAAGYAKLTEPMNNLATLMRWPDLVSESLVRGIGIVELALALGLLLPLISWKLGRWPLLVSAMGLVLLQLTMLSVHAIGMEWGLATVNAILLALTITVLLGRRAPH